MYFCQMIVHVGWDTICKMQLQYENMNIQNVSICLCNYSVKIKYYVPSEFSDSFRFGLDPKAPATKSLQIRYSRKHGKRSKNSQFKLYLFLMKNNTFSDF